MYNTRFIMSDGSVIYPAYLDREDKEKLRSQQGKQREYLRCAGLIKTYITDFQRI